MCTVALGALAASAAGYGGATAAGLGAAATAATVAASAAAGAQSGAQYEAAEYNESVAEKNADRLRGEAENERIAGSQEAQKADIETRRRTARAAVEFAGRGLDISSGTAAGLLEQSQEVGAMDALTALNNANRRAYQLEGEAINIVSQAKQQKKSARTGLYTTVLASAAKPVMTGMI
ncbi:hypothetical protein [Vibrio proteolyticus]